MHRIASALSLVIAFLASIFLGTVSAHAGENTWTGLTCNTSTTNAIECKIATLSPGASAILTVGISVQSALTYHLTANGGTAHGIDTAPTNNSVEFVTVVSALPSPSRPSGGNGGTSGGGGGGGATSPLTLLALLGLVLRRALIRSEAYLRDPPSPTLYQGSPRQETGVAR